MERKRRKDDLREEREKYEEYLKNALSKNGKIRKMHNKTHDDYRVVRTNLMNFIAKVKYICPDLADYIHEHLDIGYFLMWRE